MRNNRWLKLMVTLAVLGLITAAGSAQAANAPASSISSPALGYCSPAPRPAAGNALPSRLAAGELCSEAASLVAPMAGSWRAAGSTSGGATLSLVAFVAQTATWRDAGASHPSASAPVSVAAGWLAAIASRERFTASLAAPGGLALAWRDAGAGRR